MVSSSFLGLCLVALACVQPAAAFVPVSGSVSRGAAPTSRASSISSQTLAASASLDAEEVQTGNFWAPLLAGACMGLAVLFGTPKAALADIEDTAISVDGNGKTTFITREQLIRGKRLFNAACSICHVGGGTRTNQNVGLAMEELAGANPGRDNLTELVKYLNEPMTYDGLKDISEVHPSIKSADLYPRMRSMKQNDLYDISVYILYQGVTIPEKWGGGKIYY